MKKMIALLAAALFATAAYASTSFTYAAATDGSYTCPQACFGFTTSKVGQTVDSVGMSSVGPNVQNPSAYDITLNVDGLSYRNTNVTNPGSAFVATDRGGSGATVTVTVVFNTVRICNVTCHWHYHATGGSVVI